jgi:DHA1 family multidrug resistance protein-like MFS transporter
VLAWRRNLVAVTATSFIGFAGFTLVMPFLPLFIRQLGIEDVGEIALWTGAILGVTPALTALMSPFWGRLADRFGKRLMVARSLVACAVVMAAMSMVTHPWQIFALRALLGLLTGYGALTLTMAAESAPRDRMASAIGFVQTAQRLGPAVGPAIGGVLAGVLGLRQTFLVTATFYSVALVLVLVMYDERVAHAHTRTDGDRDATSFRSLLAIENFALLMGVVFGVQFVDRTVSPILPLYLEDLGVARGRVPVTAGLLLSLTAVSGAVGHHLCGRWLRRWPAPKVISGGALLTATGATLLATGVSPVLVAVALVLFGVGSGTAMTAVYTAAGSLIPHGAHGTGFGLLSSASLTGLAVSPVVAGALGTTTLRAVFLFDVVILTTLALTVRRVMAHTGAVTAPRVEDA